VLIERDGHQLLPELYYVPKGAIEAERQNPGSQERLPNENLPLVWAQSLYFLGQMLSEGLITPGDIDPLGRHLHIRHQRQPIVQVALLAENDALQAQLAAYGFFSQTPQQLEPIHVRQAQELSTAYTQIGRNDKLKLSGRPKRRLRSLTTARIYRICGETIVFLPSFLDQQQFYLTFDTKFLITQIRAEIAYTQRHWSLLGRPTMTLLLTDSMLKAKDGSIDPAPLLALLQELKAGSCNGVQVKLGQLNQLMLTASTERFEFLHEFEFAQSAVRNARPDCRYLAFNPRRSMPLSITQEFTLESETDIKPLLNSLRQSDNLYEQVELLSALIRLRGFEFDTGLGQPERTVTVSDLLSEIYRKAGEHKLWGVVRRVAGLNDQVSMSLSDAVTDILVRQKQIAVGRAYSEASLITQPMGPEEIMEKIKEFCREDIRDRVLTQEILIYLSLLIRSEPTLFKGFLTIRVGYMILLLTAELAQQENLTQDEAYDHLMQLSPHEIQSRLRHVLAGFEGLDKTVFEQESLTANQEVTAIEWVVREENEPDAPASENWLRKRQLDGSINRVPTDFYPSVWRVLKHCRGLVIGDKFERRNRLDHEIVLEMTPGEKNFALRVEHLLNKIQAPEYHQVNVEALMELSAIADSNPDLQIQDYIVLDVLIGHAVRLAFLDANPQLVGNYANHKAAAWRSFYETSPYDCARYIAKALQFLTRPRPSRRQEAEVADKQPQQV